MYRNVAVKKESFTHRPLIRLLHTTRVDVDILQRGGNIAVTHQDPDGLDRYAGLPEVCGKCPSEPMRVDVLHARPCAEVLEDQFDRSRRHVLQLVMPGEQGGIRSWSPEAKIDLQVFLG